MSEAQSSVAPPRALVTGSTGFIGSHLLRHLHEAGWEVHVVMRPNAEAAAQPSYVAGVHPYTGATSQIIEAVERSKPDTVFHLASLFLAAHTPGQILPLVEANVLLGTQLLEAMMLSGTKMLVNTGTSWQYFHGEQYRPVNLYAATKQAFDDILAYYADTTGMRAITLALFDSYGPGDPRKKLLRLLLDSLRTGETLLMSGGEQQLDLVHVDDICSAFLRAATLLKNPELPSPLTYAVSGGERMSLQDVVKVLERAAGKSLGVKWGARPYRQREVMDLWKGPAMPGWKPQTTLAQGFRALVEQE
jgi:nucleoside-diphosphate-sugar epimerase